MSYYPMGGPSNPLLTIISVLFLIFVILVIVLAVCTYVYSPLIYYYIKIYTGINLGPAYQYVIRLFTNNSKYYNKDVYCVKNNMSYHVDESGKAYFYSNAVIPTSPDPGLTVVTNADGSTDSTSSGYKIIGSIPLDDCANIYAMDHGDNITTAAATEWYKRNL